VPVRATGLDFLSVDFNVDWPSSCDYRLDGDAPAKQVWRDAVVNGLGAFD